MKTSPAGRAFIQSFESLELVAYPDPKWNGIKRTAANWAEWGKPWTIGYGETGPHVCEGMKCSQLQADVWFEKSLAKKEREVESLLRVPVTQGQFDALVSFAFNVGADIDADTIAEGLGDSTLLRKLNSGDYLGAAAEFPKWNKAGGRVLNGLVRRRDAEQIMFLNATPRKAPA